MPSPEPLLKGFAKTIASTKPHPKKRLTISDPDTRGLFVRITPGGARTLTVIARSPEGRQVWAAIGEVDEVKLEDAREMAREGVRRIKAGLNPFPEPTPVKVQLTFKQVSSAFVKIYVNKEDQKGERPLRSAREIERIFKKYLSPRWDDRPIESIDRDDVTALLDDLTLNNGPVMADAVLAQLSSLFSWHASRTNSYVSPIVRGMKRTKSRARARSRILTDEELRSVWSAANELGTFGAFVQISLLTGQRREKVASMRWADIAVDGTWTIPVEAGEKGNAGTLKLPVLARNIIKARPQIVDNPYVFAGRGKKAIAGFSACKREIDAKSGVTDWRIHDLRRTAKTLMRRAKVDRDTSERVLGHVIEGVEGVYDRHDYIAEKGAALVKLSNLVSRILNSKTEKGDRSGGVRT